MIGSFRDGTIHADGCWMAHAGVRTGPRPAPARENIAAIRRGRDLDGRAADLGSIFSKQYWPLSRVYNHSSSEKAEGRSAHNPNRTAAQTRTRIPPRRIAEVLLKQFPGLTGPGAQGASCGAAGIFVLTFLARIPFFIQLSALTTKEENGRERFEKVLEKVALACPQADVIRPFQSCAGRVGASLGCTRPLLPVGRLLWPVGGLVEARKGLGGRAPGPPSRMAGGMSARMTPGVPSQDATRAPPRKPRGMPPRSAAGEASDMNPGKTGRSAQRLPRQDQARDEPGS